MAKINLAVPVANLDGTPVLDQNKEPVMLNRILANSIAGKQSKEAVAEWILAQKLFKAEGELDLSAKDISIIEQTLKEAKMTTLIEGQIRVILGGE